MNKLPPTVVFLAVRHCNFNPTNLLMKKLLLVVLAVAGLGALVPNASARDHRGDRGYHYSRNVYIVEHGRPVYRRAYFDDYDRCYTYYGPRRVYVSDYYNAYPRFYRPRPFFYPPAVSLSFGFRD